MRPILAFGLCAAAIIPATALQAGVIGTMQPAPPLTAERIATLPPAQQPAWRDYLARSQAAKRADEAQLAKERAAHPAPPAVAHGDAEASMPLDREPAWYAGAEARHVADVIVSFQTPAGGWSKNQARTGPLRAPGQDFALEKDYVGTIDNGATYTELRFLARVIAQTPPAEAAAYRNSFERGVRYLLAAQYPNGGWPQVWPLVGGYHDAVTYNDSAYLGVLRLLEMVAGGKGDYAFVSVALRQDAARGWRRGLDCLLASQVMLKSGPAGWPQQVDTLTLAPVGARNFEPRSMASAETAAILHYLMSLPDPSPAVVRAVHGGAAWIAATPLKDKSWTRADPAAGRRLVDAPGAAPLWSRYYDIETGRPIFGDRDRSIHDNVNEISLERRNGYSWFDTSPGRVLTRYQRWRESRPAGERG